MPELLQGSFLGATLYLCSYLAPLLETRKNYATVGSNF
jgi:hypothetical protein